MTVSSVKTGAVGISFALDNNYMEPIATTLVGSGGTNSVIFNDIPQTYKHLQLRIFSKSTRITGYRASTVSGYFNSDFGNNYAQHTLYGDGSTMYSFASTTTTDITFGRGGSDDAANTFGISIMDILDYTNTNKYKVSRVITGAEDNTGGDINFISTLWLNTSAITSIYLTISTFTIKQHSRFSLYGIKG